MEKLRISILEFIDATDESFDRLHWGWKWVIWLSLIYFLIAQYGAFRSAMDREEHESIRYSAQNH